MSKITSRADLHGLDLAELQGLHYRAEQALLELKPGSPAWHEALTALEAIRMAISQRRMRGLGF